MQKHVLFILHDIQKSLGIEWITIGLVNNGFKLSFILINKNESEMEQFLVKINIPVHRMSYKSKMEAPVFLYKVYRKIKSANPDIVHTNLRDADVYGQTAAFICGIKKRIYTRHSSTFNHLYHKNSVKIDKLINSLVTDIISISEVTSRVLINMEGVPPNKITLIHHGFDLDGFDTISADRINLIKSKYKFPDGAVIVGVISRYTIWKGYQYIIPAFAKLKQKVPNAHFVFANTVGEYLPEIKKMLSEFLPSDSYTEIRFESDIQALYRLFNLYIHVPIDDTVEAFGQTYIEALASGVPSVFTLSGVANEFIVNEKNALVVDYKNSEQIFLAAERIINDADLRQKLIFNGKQDVKQFSLDLFIKKTIDLYLS
ncbi:glycosyltransferase family 4 protein [Mucilaginibacter sp. UYCu711]|uniref:glycosyltransferase family 4 protein n=1 Tax=Mucilaginibacter sp. UYCu711 TaxID=3156339 RepID=UPI003D1D2BB2